MSQRVEKITRIIRDTVSEVIQNHLSDPRIKGLISVTRVDLAGDLRTARVYLSVLGATEKQQEQSIYAISHASGYIQSFLAKALTIRSCPLLTFYPDSSLKKGFEVVQIIDRLTAGEKGQDNNNYGSSPLKNSEDLDEEKC